MKRVEKWRVGEVRNPERHGKQVDSDEKLRLPMVIYVRRVHSFLSFRSDEPVRFCAPHRLVGSVGMLQIPQCGNDIDIVESAILQLWRTALVRVRLRRCPSDSADRCRTVACRMSASTRSRRTANQFRGRLCLPDRVHLLAKYSDVSGGIILVHYDAAIILRIHFVVDVPVANLALKVFDGGLHKPVESRHCLRT